MELKLLKIAKEQPEQIEIRCHEVTEEIKEIVSFIKTRHGHLTATKDGCQYEIAVIDICYIEAVENKVFLYTQKQVFETKQRLYELEEMLREKYFLRVSKSLLLNLMKIRSIKPALNGRFMAVLQSGEEIIISRKYVSELKNALKGGVQ